MTMIIDGTNGLTFPDSSQQYNSYYGFKNRIINGAMVIDQRNSGTVTVNSSGLYTVDRWQANQTATGKFSVGKSTVAPAGFTNSYLATSLSAYSVSSSDIFFFNQNIEGYNIADLAWGTASAKTITLSFWVRSSLTGTFGGCLANSAHNRSYPFSYTISAADTWEQKSVTISGDTTGTWATDNTTGIQVIFGLGGGSTRSGTAGSWQAATLYTATGATSLVGTNGATFYITGVQLEKGSTATSFDYRPYGTELQLCQRYYYTTGGSNVYQVFATGQAYSTSQVTGLVVPFPTVMRSSPTFSVSDVTHFLFSDASGNGGVASAVTQTTSESSPQSGNIRGTRNAGGLVAGSASSFFANNTTSARLNWSAEL